VYAQSDAPLNGPDKIELMQLLKSGSYGRLMQKLDEVTEIMETDKTHEEYFWRAVRTFEIPDPSIESNLDDWIRQFPESSNAYAVRAEYYKTVGWNIRGYGWAKDVTEGQWRGMQEYFQKAMLDAVQGLKLDSRNLVCYDVLIAISMHYSEKSATRKFFDEAMKIDPGNLNIWVSYMWSLFPRWGGSEEEMVQLADESDRYVSYNPKLRVLHGYIPFDEGTSLYENGDSKSAIQKFNEAISFGDRSDFYRYRGHCYFDIKNYQLALDNYERALQITPQDVNLLCSKAYALNALGALDQARSIADYASKISSTSDDVKQAREYLYGDKPKAYAHATKGYDLMQAGQYEEATQEYTMAIQANPNDYTSYYNRGVCYRHLNRYDEAISDLKRTVSLSSKYVVEAYSNMGWIHSQQGKYDESVADYSWEINADPNDCTAYLNRSLSYHNLGRDAEALDDLKHACNLGCQEACDRYQRMTGK
jgi:tetratricopeptide (TPR) repeat protein